MTSNPKLSTEFLEVLQDVLDRPIAFHRVFVKLTGSVTAALILSQAMYWTRRSSSNAEGWFFKTREQWEEETGLSRYEQEGARKTLRKHSFWKEKLLGIPAQMYYRVDITALSNELFLLARSRAYTDKLNKNARLLKTSQLDGGKPSNKKEEKQPTGWLETSQQYKGISETTTETIKTTPLTPREPSQDSTAGPGGGRGFIEQMFLGTLFAAADPSRIIRAAKKYDRTSDDVAVTVDVLDQQYRKSKRTIEDPTALVVAALKDGITPPESYIPRAQREAEIKTKQEEARKRTEDARDAEQAETQAYAEADLILSMLSDTQREELFSQAKAKLHKNVRSSKTAIRSMALQLIVTKARDGPPGDKKAPR